MNCLAIGVDLGGTKIEAIALDEGGVERWRRRVPTPQGDYDGTVRAIALLVRSLREELQPSSWTVGVGTPGSVTARGTMKNCNSTCLNGRELPRDLEAAIGAPVRIANDANCLALSEATDGAGAGADVVFAAILGTGVGGGVACFGRVLTGPNGLAGEWGHTALPRRRDDEPALPCYCGHSGCVESLLSGPGLALDHARRFGGSRTAAEIAAAADRGEADSVATMQRYAERLARALSTIVNVLDPDVIVLGGGLSQVDSLYRDVPPLLQQNVFAAASTEPARVTLRRSAHGDSSGVRGAAWLWRAPGLSPSSA